MPVGVCTAGLLAGVLWLVSARLALAQGPAAGLAPDLEGARWLWVDPAAAGSAPAGRHGFRTRFTLPGEGAPAEAVITVTADNLFDVFLNGTLACSNTTAADAWRIPRTAAVAHLLRPGDNEIAVAATNTVPSPAGLILKLVVRTVGGGVVAVTTDDQWRAAAAPAEGWEALGFDDSGWAVAPVLGPLGMAPWGDLGQPAAAAPPLDFTGAQWIWTAEEGVPMGSFPESVRYFRSTFDAPEGLRGCQVEVAMAADNQFTLYLNGRRVGRGMEWTEPLRLDVTKLVVPGRNHLAVLATNTLPGPAGLIAKVLLTQPAQPPRTWVSDAGWRAIHEVLPGWEGTEFDDSRWGPARVLADYGQGPWKAVKVPSEAQPQWAFTRETDYDADPVYRDGVAFVQGGVALSAAGENFIQNIGVSRAYTEFDTPSPSALGTRLYALRPFRPDGRLTLLHDAGTGLLGAPSVSFDGSTIYFAMAPAGEGYYHLFAVSADGTGLRQVTAGPFHDFDPAELPDGRLVFASTRLGTAEEYHGVAAFSLFTCQPDGSGIRPLTHHIVGDREPRVTADGGLVFVRCDNFLERAKVETHIHRTRLDGSCGEIVLGPDREPIAGDRQTAAEAGSSWLRIYGAGCPTPLPDGRIAAITERGLVVSPERRGRVLTRYMPYDISALPDGRLLATAHDRLRLCLIDPVRGTVREAVHADDLALPGPSPGPRRAGLTSEEIHSVVSLASRPKPPVRPALHEGSTAADSPTTGFLYCQNVRATRHTSAEVDRIRAVRIYEGRPFSLVPTSSIYVHIGTEGRELGTVPIAADGSFFAEVPADRALSLQAVDAEGRPVINELSWIYVRPGEQRACVGCHAPSESAPPRAAVQAVSRSPLRLLGEGEVHRFRANNAANGGVLNQQLARFREIAGVNLHEVAGPLSGAPSAPLPPGRAAEVERLCRAAESGSIPVSLAAVQQLAILGDRRALPVLVQALGAASTEVRCAAALGLAVCGDRRAAAPLLERLDDPHASVAQAAQVALGALTGRGPVASVSQGPPGARGSAAWRQSLGRPDWPAIEAELCAVLAAESGPGVQAAVEALGHIGGPAGAAALRQWLSAHGDADLRVLEAALRALGRLQDAEAVPGLGQILKANLAMPGEGVGGREFGFGQRPVYLAAAAAQALGWIGTPAAQGALLEALPQLPSLEACNLACGDHPWLMGSHPPVIHYRVLEALDAMGTRLEASGVPVFLRAIPMDKDRALLYERDDYETLTARVVQRSGQAGAVVETCLAVLGDPAARREAALVESVTASPHAEAHIRLHSAEARAAQVLAVVCLDAAQAGRVRERLSAWLAQPSSETRSWVCFMLVRSVAWLHDRSAAPLLVTVLEREPVETAAGTNPPPCHWVHKAQKPFFRAAAAYALGGIGDDAVIPALEAALANLENAPAVREQSAVALTRLSAGRRGAELARLAEAEAALNTRRALLQPPVYGRAADR